MTIRPYEVTDREAVLSLWYKNNKSDVYLPNESDCKFKTVFTDEEGNLIGFSCINMLPELILVHDKKLLPHKKYELLMLVHEINKRHAKDVGWIQLYAFLEDKNWIRHLMDVGYKLFEKGIYYLELRK